MKRERVNSIEIWRVFFVCMVLIWHTKYLPWSTAENQILRSAHGVDFFLLLSGYLMAKHAERPQEAGLGKDSLQFILHKIGSFYPMYLLAVIFDLLSRWLVAGYTVEPEKLRFYVWDLLLLREAGLHGETLTTTAIGSSWYLMAMVLAMALLYPMLRANKDVFLRILAPLITVFLYGWFSQVKGMLYFTLKFEHGVSLGLLRAVAGICLGCVCYQLAANLRRTGWNRNRLIRAAATLAELAAVYSVVHCSIRYKAGPLDFVCVLLEALLLISEFGGFSLLSDLAEKVKLGWVGSFTLALYISHFTWIYILIRRKPDWSREEGLAVFFAAAILTAIGFVWLQKGIRRMLTRTGIVKA